MSPSAAKILIIGAGAVGSFIGARLALAGHAVTFAGRPGLAEVLKIHGLALTEPDGQRRWVEARGVDGVAAAFDVGAQYDLAVITVKAFDTAQVIVELAAVTADPPPLISLQNGVGNEEALAAAFGADRIIAGAIDTPVSVPAPGQVAVHRARFRAGLAPVGPTAAAHLAAALLRDAGLRVDLYADYRRLKWTKLLLNLLANAQCAILDWTPAQVMADPIAAQLEARAWQEALAVMAGQHIRPVTLAGYPVGLAAPIARRVAPGWLAAGLRRLVSGGRGSKMPSLHMALTHRKRSEAPWLNGAVADHGARLGIPTPVNRALADVLAALAEGREPHAAWRGRPERLASLA